MSLGKALSFEDGSGRFVLAFLLRVMGQIHQLPELLINQIAAGEVVERPASAVKELVENSLDAGAKKIIIEVNGGGDNFLRITDDGCGMDSSDAVLAFERHATSKISTTDDLFTIHTLGFRGEAIASISAVSLMTLQTKKRGDLEGTLVIAEGGKISKIQPVGVPEGTQIEVQNLFFNTPARKKYLKNDSTEYQHIVDTVTGIALTFPHVSFRVVHDGKLVFDLPAVEDELSRIRAVFGKIITDDLVPVFYGHSQIHLKGFIGKPVLARSNRNYQYLFINNREVKSHVLGYAVKQSYATLLPKEKYPVFFLYFEIDPALVDVNVHPRKLEVRFRDEREIFSATTQACKRALETYVLAPNITGGVPVNYYAERKAQPLELRDSGAVDRELQISNDKLQITNDGVPAGRDDIFHGGGRVHSAPSARGWHVALAPASIQGSAHTGMGMESGSVPEAPTQVQNQAAAVATNTETLPISTAETVQQAMIFTSEFLGEKNPAGQERKHLEPIAALAQLNNSYILCRQSTALVIVDQHAAHERIRYTQIFEEFSRKKIETQTLAAPLQLELSSKEIALFEEHRELFVSLGFEAEPFGGKTFALHGVPSYLSGKDIRQAFLGMLDNCAAGSGSVEEQTAKALTYLACRSAVKFGDPLGWEEQVSLIEKLQTLDQPYTCPHGRPTMIVMSSDELKKRFGREYSGGY